MEVATSTVRSLKIQNILSYFNLFWFGPLFIFLLRIVGGYKCEDIAGIRKKVDEYLEYSGDKPLIICSNHLTMIDSMLLTWILFGVGRIYRDFRLFPWNVPEIKNFGSNFLLRAMCYLGKCVYIERKGSLASKKDTWGRVRHLIKKGEIVCIFPEGGRSRTGPTRSGCAAARHAA